MMTNSNIRFGDPLRAARYKTFLQRSFLDRLSTNLNTDRILDRLSIAFGKRGPPVISQPTIGATVGPRSNLANIRTANGLSSSTPRRRGDLARTLACAVVIIRMEHEDTRVLN